METLRTDEADDPGVRWMKRGLVVFVGFAVGLGLYLGYWTVMARHLEQRLDAWVEARARDGLRISFARRTIDGFPLRLRLRLGDARLNSGDWRAVVRGIEASAAPWRLGRIDYQIGGTAEISRGPGTAGAQARRFIVTASGFGGEVVIDGAGGALGLVADNAEVAEAGRRLGGMRRFDLDLAWRPEPPAKGAEVQPLAIDLGIDGGELPAAWTTPLGRRFATLRLSGHVAGPLPGGGLVPALMQWRDAGGTLEIKRFAVKHGALNLDAEGTAALDGDMQPEAALTVRAEGYLETIEALVNAGLMRPNEGTAAKLVLTIVAKRPAGRPAYVETPLTLQERVLSAGELRLARIAPVRWRSFEGLVLPTAAGSAKISP